MCLNSASRTGASSSPTRLACPLFEFICVTGWVQERQSLKDLVDSYESSVSRDNAAYPHAHMHALQVEALAASPCLLITSDRQQYRAKL
jgi:hypothetical protein